MEFSSHQPIYIQIKNLIKTKMVSGEICEGEKLPSVREFSKELKVNPNTIQRAFQELEREGIVVTQRGTGTFATDDIQKVQNLKKRMATEIIEQFFMEMKNLGFKSDEIKQMITERLKEEIE